MPNSSSEVWKFLEERFGIDRDEFSRYELVKKSGDWWLTTGTCDLEVETNGVRAVRELDIGLKPTTYLLQILGDSISRNVFEPTEEEFLKLMRREEMIDADFEKEGYVAIRFRGRIAGCGFYKDGVVSSRVSKGRAGELADLL